MSFTTTAPVRFAHVDAAGIVFYPRYFEMLNAAVEDWFAHLGCDFKTLHLDRRLGVPTVDLRCTFMAPSQLGDELRITIVPREPGRSSCGYDFVMSADGRDRAKRSAVLV